MEIIYRVYDAGVGVLYKNVKTGLLEYCVNNSVVASAYPKRNANYNKLVTKCTGYLGSYIKDNHKVAVIKENVVPVLEMV